MSHEVTLTLILIPPAFAVLACGVPLAGFGLARWLVLGGACGDELARSLSHGDAARKIDARGTSATDR